MKFYIPPELNDPMMRASDTVPRGDTYLIDALASEIDIRRQRWLDAHPGWTYTGTALIKCLDGTPPPAYDVRLGFKRPRTPTEKADQDRDREAYVAQKEADFARRAEEQKVLFERVLTSLKPQGHRPLEHDEKSVGS